MEYEQLIEEARHTDELFYEPMQDVQLAIDVWESRGDMPSHRMYVRTVFSLVEGVIQHMKQSALLFDRIAEEPTLSPEEVTLLKEEEVHLGSGGKPRVRPKKLPMLDNFEFALRTYSKVMGITVDMDKAGSGWESFCKAAKIRDCVTHPKTVSDLAVSNSEMEVVERAMSYFRTVTSPLLHRKHAS